MQRLCATLAVDAPNVELAVEVGCRLAAASMRARARRHQLVRTSI
jgi:hypothetical protein